MRRSRSCYHEEVGESSHLPQVAIQVRVVGDEWLNGAAGLLNRAERRFVISATVQKRLQRWGGIQSDVLYPPPPAREYRCDSHGDYLFAVSRLTPHKRFDLILRALAEPIAAGIRCVMAGEGRELKELTRLRNNLDLSDRVEFIGRSTCGVDFITREQDLDSGAQRPRACAPLPRLLQDAADRRARIVAPALCEP